MADQCEPPIIPTAMYRFSEASLAPSRTILDFQSACDSTKSIPCFALARIEFELHGGEWEDED